MSVGDLILKATGNDKEQIGILLEMTVSPVGHKMLAVLSRGKIKNWYHDYCELII